MLQCKIKRQTEHPGESPVLHSNFALALRLTRGERVCVRAALAIRPPLSFPCCVHKSTLHPFISTPALGPGVGMGAGS